MTSSFFYVFLASFAIAVSGYAMTITLRKKGSIGGFLSIYFPISFLTAFCFDPLLIFKTPFSPAIATLGGFTGLLMIALMVGIGIALKAGPSALTFAFLNSGSMVPPLLMALFFGTAFGFPLTSTNVIGMAITLVGLFWAVRNSLKENLSLKWLFWTSAIFLFQGLLLTLYQWRCLLITENLPSHLLIPFHCAPEEDFWFMPALFAVAGFFQLIYFYLREKRGQNKVELIGGVIGGFANGLGTLFLLKAALVATPSETAMLFPLYAVFVILICNLAGRLFYREKINWAASAILVSGILIGMLL